MLNLEPGEDWTLRYFPRDGRTVVEFSKTSVYQGSGTWDDRLDRLVLLEGNIPDDVVATAEATCRLRYP